MHELINKKARELVTGLRSGELHSDDLLDALEQRIGEVEEQINALPTLCFECARQKVKQINRDSVLAGLPIPIKDLTDVAGVRTTYGSLVSEHHVPKASDLLVRRIEENGGVIYAKSNTPEFGSGGNTFNDVFGYTRNPHNLSLSAAGSSGGAAAALASGTAWLAHGSDLAGSLRTPASFCGVCSLRPSPGLIASSPGIQPFNVYPQNGPMARDVNDLALFTDAMAGESAQSGLSKAISQRAFRDAAERLTAPGRIAFSDDLGITEPSNEVRSLFTKAIEQLDANGLILENAAPDLSRCDAAFDIPRALNYAASYGEDLEQIRSMIKPENVWNIEYGLELDNKTILDSMRAQGELFANAASFMQDYDLLIVPASVTTAYPVEERYPGFSDGLPYHEYYRWLRIAYAITATTLPVITLPCGKTGEGLPLGIQLIGKPHGEIELFSYAARIEEILGWDSSIVDS